MKLLQWHLYQLFVLREANLSSAPPIHLECLRITVVEAAPQSEKGLRLGASFTCNYMV